MEKLPSKKRNNFTINNFFTDLFIKADTTQIEFGHMTETDKNSVHDWIKHKNQMRFDKLETICKKLGYTIEIKVNKIK